MKITVENGKMTTISLSGQLDTLTSVDFEKEISRILAEEVEVITLNVEELTYVSSAGLRLLLTLQKGMKAKGGTFQLTNVRKEIMDIFNTTGFSSFLTIK